jgi:hypothetical protein
MSRTATRPARVSGFGNARGVRNANVTPVEVGAGALCGGVGMAGSV